MAQKRKYSGKWYFPRLDESFALATLAAADVISQQGGTAVVDSTRVTSIKVGIGVANLDEADGPVVIGVAHSDYTDPEIEEWMEATASWDLGDKIAQERRKRRCRILATLTPDVASGGAQAFNGAQRKFKLNMLLSEGDSLNFFAYNRGAATMQTGAEVKVTGNANCRIE